MLHRGVLGGVLLFVAVVAGVLSRVAGRSIVIGTERYSPAPVLVGVSVVAAAAGLVVLHRWWHARRVLSTGVSAEATIIAVQETATRVNGQPLCRFRLSVTRPGREPYEATATRVLGVGDVHRVAPGSSIMVRVNPDDPSDVVIAE